MIRSLCCSLIYGCIHSKYKYRYHKTVVWNTQQTPCQGVACLIHLWRRYPVEIFILGMVPGVLAIQYKIKFDSVKSRLYLGGNWRDSRRVWQLVTQSMRIEFIEMASHQKGLTCDYRLLGQLLNSMFGLILRVDKTTWTNKLRIFVLSKQQ